MTSRGKKEGLEQVEEHDVHVSKKRRHGAMGAGATTESPQDQIQAGNSSADAWCSEFEAEKSASQLVPKKPCLKPADVMVNIKSVSRLSTEIRSSLEPTMQVWGYINKLLRHPGPSQIVVPKSNDSWISMAMGYVRQDLDKIKALIGAPVLDKVALVAKIATSLKSWEMLLHGHADAVSKELSSLMRELEDLKRNLSDDDAQAAKRSEEGRIQGHLTTANNSLRSVTRSLASIKDHDAALDWEKLVGEAGERKRQCLSKVKELETALCLARSDLSKEEEREANILSSRARNSNMVSRASEAVADLSELLAQTNTCWEAMRGSIQDEGISAELWFQLKFVESCQIESADE